ncbi:tetratricopeptide repeat protein [Delftia sp. PS-11]|uniref:tetratricopeptide repeat protein n=1 Tax=Delftia sp. PS-11 TaxID=2767222 RepID=UPI0024557668|nr:tetratricopeptide repeat protein [Delftia sp. PS-11]KAJ8745964.1 tetratricopeptide repeat protein [Delftia sp. PS-11]
MADAGAGTGTGTGSAAWSLCPVQPRYPLPATGAEQQQALEGADAAMPQCLHSAPYYAWRGALQLVLGRAQEAAESLERALLLDPDLPGAQLDYAQALATLGDLSTARELLEQLRQRPDLPVTLRALMQQDSRGAQAQAEAASSYTRVQLSTAWGYDSNLNNAPAASQLALTLPQGSVLLPLDSAYRPRSGSAWLSTAQWQHIRAFDGQALLLSADLRGRATAESSRTGYLQGDFAAQWLQAPEAPSQWMARVAWGRLEFGSEHWLTTQRASLQHQWRLSPAGQEGALATGNVCRATLGLDLENRQYPISPELDGRYLGGAASLFCTPAAQAAPVAVESAEAAGWASGWSLAHYGLQLRWGQDHARSSTRPGGRYDRLELSLGGEARLGRLRLGADYSWTRQGDKDGYSPLFDNNLRRNTLRQGLRLTVSQPLADPAWRGALAFVSLEASRQQSNIAAFAMRQRAISAGLRWELP